MRPGDLLAAIASLIALWNCVDGALSVDSGSSRGVGEKSTGRLRPRGPSGEDCIERVAGLAVDDVSLGVRTEAGVTGNGTEVLIWCLAEGGDVGRVVGEEDGQPRFPFVRVGEEVAGFTEAVMMDSLREAIHWIASGMQSAEVSVLFRVVLRCRFNCSVVDGELRAV